VDIQLRVHWEPVEGAGWVWWADSEQLPGFSAAADHLPELIERAHAAIREEGLAVEGARITTVIAPVDWPSEPAALNDAETPGLDRGPERQQALSTRKLVSA
jgi:hypothetical protein